MNFCVARKPVVLRLRFFARRTAGKVVQDYPPPCKQCVGKATSAAVPPTA